MDRVAFTVPEFCAAFRISRAHLYNLINRGEGPAFFKAGRRTLICRDSAAQWAQRMESLAGARRTQGGGRP
jgi:predicted DNA-binding transcriptional regulator AlpA